MACVLTRRCVHTAAFVDAEASAVAAAVAAKHAAKDAGGTKGRSAKRVRRGYASSDEDDEDESDDASSSPTSDDEEDATPAAEAAASATDIRAAAQAAVRAMIAHRFAKATARAELQQLLALAALEHACPTVANMATYIETDAYAAFLKDIEAPPAKPKRGALPPNAAAVAAEGIAAPLMTRAVAIDAALETKLVQLCTDWNMSRADLCTLLGCGGTRVPLEKLTINDTCYRESYILNGEVRETPRPGHKLMAATYDLDAAVDVMMTHLKLKLRKGGAACTDTCIIRAAAPDALPSAPQRCMSA